MKERRELLGLLGITVSSTLAGCLGGGSEAGDLRIDNDDEETHTVGVGVTKTSDNPERVRSGGTPPNPELSPEWTRTDEFEVAPYEEFVAEGFFSEPGAYYIECRVDGGELKTLWLPFYASQTAEVRGQYLILDITDDGRLSLYTSGYD